MIQLRWLVEPGTSTAAPRLQFRERGNPPEGWGPSAAPWLAWMDVPTVVDRQQEPRRDHPWNTKRLRDLALDELGQFAARVASTYGQPRQFALDRLRREGFREVGPDCWRLDHDGRSIVVDVARGKATGLPAHAMAPLDELTPEELNGWVQSVCRFPAVNMKPAELRLRDEGFTFSAGLWTKFSDRRNVVINLVDGRATVGRPPGPASPPDESDSRSGKNDGDVPPPAPPAD